MQLMKIFLDFIKNLKIDLIYFIVYSKNHPNLIDIYFLSTTSSKLDLIFKKYFSIKCFK